MKVKHALTIAVTSVVTLGIVGMVMLDVGDMSQTYTQYKLEQNNGIEIEHIQKLTATKEYVEDMWVDRSNNLAFKTVRPDSPLSSVVKSSYLRNLLKRQADDMLFMYRKEVASAGFIYKKGDTFIGKEYSSKPIKIPVLSKRDITLFDFNDKVFADLYRLVQVVQKVDRPNSYYLDIRGVKQGRIILSDLKSFKSVDDVKRVLGNDVRSKMLKTPTSKK